MTIPTGQLFINGRDAGAEYGVAMGDGFMAALLSPTGMKDYVEGRSRLENGKTVLTDNARVDSRDVTLPFNVHGATENAFRTNLQAFCRLLYAGAVTLSVRYPNGDESGNFRLVYKKSTTFSLGRTRLACTVQAKFEEPDPTDRD